jgi:hypothetical protein
VHHATVVHVQVALHVDFISTDKRPDNRSYKHSLRRLLFRFPCHFTMTKLCRFYKNGNCRYGDRCRDSHIQAGETPGPSTSAPPSPRNRPSIPPNLPESSSPSPSGACSFYWRTGNCKLEFECRYKHIRDGEIIPQRPKFNLAGNDTIAPFLTEQGLAKINGIATDGFFEEGKSTLLSPTEAHSRFKRFLWDTFRFQTSFDIYSFFVPLNSASCHNSLWVCISLNSSTICYLFRIRRKKKGRYAFLLIITTVKLNVFPFLAASGFRNFRK